MCDLERHGIEAEGMEIVQMTDAVSYGAQKVRLYAMV
jgi:hypothetical protein